jgi:hypothetical protein
MIYNILKINTKIKPMPDKIDLIICSLKIKDTLTLRSARLLE